MQQQCWRLRLTESVLSKRWIDVCADDHGLKSSLPERFACFVFVLLALLVTLLIWLGWSSQKCGNRQKVSAVEP